MSPSNNEDSSPGAIPVVVEGAQNRPPLRLRAEKAYIDRTVDQPLWSIIRFHTDAIGFHNYVEFLEPIMNGQIGPEGDAPLKSPVFPGVHAYALLKAATEVFVMARCGIKATHSDAEWAKILAGDEEDQREVDKDRRTTLRSDWEERYRVPGPKGPELRYLSLIRRRLGLPVVEDDEIGLETQGLLQSKMVNPCMIELIWSYWHEEGMLVQTMNALSMRFQNRRRPGGRDPLVSLEIDALRVLGPLLWGFVHEESQRLTVARRAYEYEHQYGFTLQGKAIRRLRPADTRPKLLELFHNLLYQCTRFYLVDDDTTRVADGFPVLKALKRVHLALSEGAHNQFGELPWNARVEMLMMQWILSRPELREFLGGRAMIAYPEPWMEQVEAMKTLQRWTDTETTYFRELAIYGERILLSARFGAWSNVLFPQYAGNWARYWRPEIQSYLDAYSVATGIDLSTPPPSDAREAAERNLAPSVHLARRLAEQHRRR